MFSLRGGLLELWGYRLSRGDSYGAVHDWPSLLGKLFKDLRLTFCADERGADNIDGLHQLCDDRLVTMSMDICEKDPRTLEEFADSQWVASLMRRYERDTPPEFFARPLAPHILCAFMTKSKTVAVFCMRFVDYPKAHEDDPVALKFAPEFSSSGAFDSDDRMGAEMAAFAFKHSQRSQEAQEALEVMPAGLIMLGYAQPGVADIIYDASNSSVVARAFYFHLITRAITFLHEQTGEVFSMDGHSLDLDGLFSAQAMAEMMLSEELSDHLLDRVVKGICTFIRSVDRIYGVATPVVEAVLGLVKASHSFATQKIIVRELLRIIKQVDDIDLLSLDCEIIEAIGAVWVCLGEVRLAMP
jgi:hypothetical protein